MKTRRKKQKNDKRDLIIGILSVLVIVETFLLVYPLREKFLPKRTSQLVEAKKEPAVQGKTGPSEGSRPVKEILRPQLSVPPVPRPPKGSAGKIAFILDDWGYQMGSCKDLRTIEAPLAIAILPKLEHSQGIAQCAHDNNKVVMLHLPLEPHKYLESYPDDYYIKTSMTEKRVIRMLEEALRDIPHVEGVNNHTGSKATEDAKIMSIIFNRLKEKDLFFVDSFVTSASVCRTVAQKIKLNFARRDIFLDNEDRREYIEGQFAELAKQAKAKGSAVAIGHDRPLTLKILHEQIKILEDQGFQIVNIKELLKTK